MTPVNVIPIIKDIQKGIPLSIFELTNEVGGNSRTITKGEFRYDTGAHRLHNKHHNVTQMVNNIACSDLFVAGSTGPLHIAGALNKKTVGFYPSKKSSTILRWQKINNFHKRLSITDTDRDKKNISVDIKKTVLEIQKLISSEEIIGN